MRPAVMLLLGLMTLPMGCSGDDDPALSMDDLRDAGSTCPVDVGQAIKDAGVEVEAAGDIEVEVEAADSEGPDDSESESETRNSESGSDPSPEVGDETPLARANGVYVDCTQPLGGGDESLSVQILAGDEGFGVNGFAPQLARDLDISTDVLESLLNEIWETDTGRLADLPGDAAVAITQVDIDGAASSGLYVDSDALTRDDVEAIGEAIIEQL